MELISIIVPVYNVEQYIRKCINSLINQTYKNLEIILIDDGSPDKSGIICEEYAAIDSRIKVIHQENGGLSAARNSGLDAVSGDYIIFVDSDDFLKVDAVEILLSNAKKHSADMVICNFEFIDNEGKIRQSPKLSVNDGVISKDDYWEHFYSNVRTFYVTMWADIFKSSLWRNLRFPVGKLYEDEFVIHKLIDKSRIIAISKQPVYYYLQRSASIVHTKFKVSNLDAAEGMMHRCEFFINKRKFKFAMNTLSMAAYSLSRIGRLSKEERKKNKKRINELYKHFRILYRKLFLKKISFYSRVKCGMFYINMNLFIRLFGKK